MLTPTTQHYLTTSQLTENLEIHIASVLHPLGYYFILKILRGRIHVFFLSLIFSWQPSWNLSFSHGLWKEQNKLISSVTVYSLIISIQYLKEKLIIIIF